MIPYPIHYQKTGFQEDGWRNRGFLPVYRHKEKGFEYI